jgi:hypothetical protein
VVSKDLLTAGPADTRGLYPYFADQLAVNLGLSAGNLTPGWEINDVACQQLKEYFEPEPIYTALDSIVSRSETLAISPSLLKLAAILPLKLFVSTTFDSSLSRALNQVRYGGEPRTRTVSYTRSVADDLPADTKTVEVPTVFHLLGKATPAPNYAVTQWDMVEYFHDLHTGPRPELLLDELKSQSMLILGSSFDGWLARFFVRLAKGQIGGAAAAADYIADPQMTGDANLVLFIRRLRRGTKIYSTGGAVQFIDQLYARWKERHPDPDPGGPPPPPPPPDPDPSVPGAVFLSYAREDRDAVTRIKEALSNEGVKVFVDTDGLEAGDVYTPKLKRKIVEASLFIPIISQNSLSRPRRFAYLEWRLAIEEAQKASFSPDFAFLIPVSIDGTRPSNPAVPSEFRPIHWQTLPGGTPSAAFVDRIKELYRRYQKSLVQDGN